MTASWVAATCSRGKAGPVDDTRQPTGDERDLVDGRGTQQVESGDLGEHAPVPHPQCNPAALTAVASEAVLFSDRGEQLPPHLDVGRQARAGMRQLGELLWMAEEEIPESGRRTQERPQGTPPVLARTKRPHGGGISSRDEEDRRDGDIGIGRVRRGVAELLPGHVDELLEFGEVRIGLRQAAEADARETGQGRGAIAGHGAGVRASRGCSSTRTA